MSYDIEDFTEALREASDAAQDDHTKAREMIEFMVGGPGQWRGADLRKVQDEQRPALTINQTKPVIAAVSGSEQVNRFEPRFLPRSPSLQDVDAYAADAMSEIYKWARQQSDVEHHESKAFRNTATAGLGWVHTFMDYSENPWGEIKTVWVPMFEVAHDPNAKQMNLRDREYVFRGKWIPVDDFHMFWPDAEEDVYAIASADQTIYSGFAGNQSVVGGNYDPTTQGAITSGWFDAKTQRVLIYEWQYTFKEMWYRVFMPPQTMVSYETDAEDANEYGMRVVSGVDWIPLDERDVFIHAARGSEVDPETINLVKMPRQRYRSKMVCNSSDLEDSLIRVDDFTLQAITGFEDEGDESRVRWNGLVYDMLDPQMLVNKVLSQIVYFLSLNPNAMVAEDGVFTDKEQAESDLSNPSKIVTVARNALRDGRIKDKLGRAPIPSGLGDLLQFAMEAIPRTGGVNPYFLGAVNDLKRTPASAVQSVQRQSMMILSTLMDSLRLHRKDHARLVMKFVKEYMSSEQVNRVLSPELQQMGMGQVIMQHDVQEFDVVVDEAPTTPNAQAEFRADMMQSNFIPQLLQLGVPMPPEIFNYLGLPATVARKWQDMYQSFLSSPPQPPVAGDEGTPPS